MLYDKQVLPISQIFQWQNLVRKPHNIIQASPNFNFIGVIPQAMLSFSPRCILLHKYLYHKHRIFQNHYFLHLQHFTYFHFGVVEHFSSYHCVLHAQMHVPRPQRPVKNLPGS